MSNSKANQTQVGGNHYKNVSLEHWDFVALRRLDYFQACITKYVFRHRSKGGVQDLRKAAHYLAKYLELEAADQVTVASTAMPSSIEFCTTNGVPALETRIICLVSDWAGRVDHLVLAENELKNLIAAETLTQDGDAGAGYVGQ